MTYHLQFVNNTAYVSNDTFRGQAAQDFVSQEVIICRRSSHIIAPNRTEMHSTIAMLPRLMNDIVQKTNKTRCTEFVIGTSILRVRKSEDLDRLVARITNLWHKTEP